MMNRIQTARKLASWTLILILVFVIAGVSVEAEQPIELSGHVVDMEGNPVPDLIFAIERVDVDPEDFMPLRDLTTLFSVVKTDSEGAFATTDVPAGLVRLTTMPNAFFENRDRPKIAENREFPPKLQEQFHQQPATTIHALQIGQIIYLNLTEHGFFYDGNTLELEPGMALENIKVILRSRLELRARVIYENGEPVANAEARLKLSQRHELYPNRTGRSSLKIFTDADGYFSTYPLYPGFYTMSVTYMGLSGGQGPFLLKADEQLEELVLRLGTEIEYVKPPLDLMLSPGAAQFQAEAAPLSDGVWIINPTNGHAYKRIRCEGWHDAQRKAIAEGAHLVSINNEAEQRWIDDIFPNKPFWIGLTDAAEEGEWQWDSGEPVNYESWILTPIIIDVLPETEKDYVVLTFGEGGWQSAGPESRLWQMTRQAIIEKDGLISTVIPEEPPK